VREFLEALDEEAQAAIDNHIARLNPLGDRLPHLPFPHSSQVESELRELRCHYGRRLYRILGHLAGTRELALGATEPLLGTSF
jgi:hypothetical protein